MRLFTIFLLAGVLVLNSCKSAEDEKEHSYNPNFEEVQVPEKKGVYSFATPKWDEMLKRNSGWIGADGVFSVPLTGVKAPGQAAGAETMVWFSDNIWGEISGDTLADDWVMTNNCVAYLQGDQPDSAHFTFFSQYDEDGNPSSMFVPETPNSKPGDYYWLGDGFFNHAMDSTIYIFSYRIRNVPGDMMYPFEFVGLSLIAIPKGSRPPYPDQRQYDVPYFNKNALDSDYIIFGNAVLANTQGAGAPDPDGYIYIYGIREPKKELVVARVEDHSFEDFSKWRFWDGESWTNRMKDCATLLHRVSNEMSVSLMEDGRVLAIYQLDTNSPDVMACVGKTPVGPYYIPFKIWSTPEIYEDIDFYTYNAKAHPHLSKPGELLISYNVNSFDFLDDIKHKPHHLRPRFFTLKY